MMTTLFDFYVLNKLDYYIDFTVVFWSNKRKTDYYLYNFLHGILVLLFKVHL